MSISHPLLAAIPKRLLVSPAQIDHTPAGTAFVVSETGCWLTVTDQVLHIEVRVAAGVTETLAALEFCADRNEFALVGRWVYDENAGVLALVADLALPEHPSYDVEAVAVEVVGELVNAAGTVIFHSADLAGSGRGGVKATPAINGIFVRERCKADEYLPRVTYPLGGLPDLALSVLLQAQAVLVVPLLGWGDVTHSVGELCAERSDGHRLVLRVAQHPSAGWGLVLSVRVPGSLDVRELNELNLRAAPAGRPLLSRWVGHGDSVEHRLFLTNAVLLAAEVEDSGADQLICQRVRDLELTLTAGPAPLEGTAVLRPVWPDEDKAIAYARQDPWHEYRAEDDPRWFVISLDRFGRMVTLTDPTYRAWRASLLPSDLEVPGVAAFIAYLERQIAATLSFRRAERSAELELLQVREGRPDLALDAGQPHLQDRYRRAVALAQLGP